MFFKKLNSIEAKIKGGKNHPNINGIINFKETKKGIIMTVNIKGLPQSKTHCVRKIFWFSYT